MAQTRLSQTQAAMGLLDPRFGHLTWERLSPRPYFKLLMGVEVWDHACLGQKVIMKPCAKMCSLWYFMPVSASPAAEPGVAVRSTMLHIIHLIILSCPEAV